MKATSNTTTTATDAATAELQDFLARQERKDLLRFVTAGSVDDGKSTLIGRLLFESQGIFEDQLAAIRKASGRRGSAHADLDLSLVTDGLKAEREQGITIDVAYRYFTTPRRKFIIADTPGHEQYTRNMATGASMANLMVILIDAANGVTTQSRRHAFIGALLGIPHIVVVVNKMDLVDYDPDVFARIREEFADFAAKLEIRDLTFIPVSSLYGDNVVRHSQKMPWYGGTTLLNHLETVHIASDRNLIDLRLPVQYVTRLDDKTRGLLGTIASGVIRPGDEVTILPGGHTGRVQRVLGPGGEELAQGYPPQAVTVVLEQDVDVSRGNLLVRSNNVPPVESRFDAMVVWMSEGLLETGRPYYIKHATQIVPGEVSAVRYRIDVNTLHRQAVPTLGLNEIGRCAIHLHRPIALDPYTRNRQTGSFILIDRVTHNTVGAGILLDRKPSEAAPSPERWTSQPKSEHVHRHTSRITPEQRTERLGHNPGTLWLTGLCGSGKSTLAYALEERLFQAGHACAVLDGENLRLGLNKDLDFSGEGRSENIRRAAQVAQTLNEAGLIAICAFIAPHRLDREHARDIVGPDRFFEVHTDAPIDLCRQRDPHGLYELAESGEVQFFPGVTAPYERPEAPALHLDTEGATVEQCVDRLVELLRQKGILPA